MSVVGVDFGNLNTVIAVARNRGIDVITNDVSNRLTPSMISFSPKARQLGESAKTLEISNFKNTIASIKRLIGVPFDALEYVTIEKNYLNCELVKDDKSHYGGIAVRITPPENDAFLDGNGNTSSFVKDEEGKITLSMVQLVAMYLGKVKEITEHALGRPVCDTVLSVPMYFTDGQRRALLDAAQVVNLNVLRLIHDTTACGLAYGIPKSDLPEVSSTAEGGAVTRPRYVCIIDFGQSSYQVSIMAFTKGKLEVRGSAYDMHLGGRNFDEAMVNSLVKDLNHKYKIHLQDYPKSMYRLRLACERTKKILSANNKAVLGIENLLNDVDVSMEVTRTDLEAGPWQDLLHNDRLLIPVRAALAQARLQPSDMDVVELVGGSSRIPSFRELISKFFNGMELSQTLNQDEAVARGAAFQCAILSPTFKVKDFTVVDSLSLPIHFYWESIPSEPEDKDIVLFDRGDTIPSTKLLTFFRENDFTVTAEHDNLNDPVFAAIGSYTITMKNNKNVALNITDHPESLRVKVKVRLNGNGIVGIEQATLFEEQEQDISTDNTPPSEESLSQDVSTASASSKKKVLVKKGDITVQMVNRSIPSSIIATYQELELSMHTADRLVIDTEVARNSLEEYIYEMRGKINSDLAMYANAQDKLSLTQNLQAVEDWLYSDTHDGGAATTKSVYLNKLASLKALGDPIFSRKNEDEAFQATCIAWANTAEKLRNQLTSQDAKYDHIPFIEREPVLARLETAWKSSLEKSQEHSRMDKTTPVPKTLLASSLKKELEEIVLAVSSLMNRPKPKATPPPVTNTPPVPENSSASPASSNVFTDESGNVTVQQMDLD